MPKSTRWLRSLTVVSGIVAWAAACGSGPAESTLETPSYPQFLGPRRDATLPEARLEPNWQAHPPRELWRRPIGAGWSAFAVYANLAVTQEQLDDAEWIVAYELETGAERWRREHAPGHETALGGRGPRATPSIHGGRAFALSATGVLTAVRLTDGEVLWSENLIRRHGARPLYFGQASSPLVVEGRVVVSIGGRGGESVVAYDVETGELAWASGHGRATYSSPALLRFQSDAPGEVGVEHIVVLSRRAIAGYSKATGELLWSAPWREDQPVAGQPLAVPGDGVLVSAGYGIGSKLYRVRGAGPGTPTAYEASLAWEGITLKSRSSSYVLHEGSVLGLDAGFLVAIDPTDGRRLWKSGRYGDGQLLLAGDHLLVLDDTGVLHLIQPRSDGPIELASLAALSGTTYNPPVLAGHHLLLRNAAEAVCYEIALRG